MSLHFIEKFHALDSLRLEIVDSEGKYAYSAIVVLSKKGNIDREKIMSEFRTIEIDFEIHKRIEAERKSLSEPDYKIVHRLLKIDPAVSGSEEPGKFSPPNGTNQGGVSLRYGVSLPSGTELRLRYNGVNHFGNVRDGAIWVNGKSFQGPSPAAIEITKSSVNGWIKWEANISGKWILLDALRKRL